jgi:hypothetical protein
MRYSEEDVALAQRLFETPIQPGLYFSTCSFCGELAIEGSRYVNEPIEAAMHHDCFVVTIPDRIPKVGPFTSLYQIQDVSVPRVVVTQQTLQRLVSKAVDLFPYQHNFFSLGRISEDEISIDDFIDVPFFRYEMPKGKFSNYEIDNSEPTLKTWLEILKQKIPNGYIHSHDGNDISISDLVYDNIYSKFIPQEFHRSFRIHIQLDTFYPTFKHLVLLHRHELKRGKSLVVSYYSRHLPTKYLYKYIKPRTEKDRKTMETARQLAKETIVNNPERYLGAYTTIVDSFVTLKNDEINEMLEELGATLSKIIVYKNVENSRFIKFIQGKIKQLPLVIS